VELPENYRAFSTLASEFSAWVLETLQVKKIERVGLRIIQIAKRQHFKLLLSKMRENLFALTDDDWNILGGQLEDIAMPLTLAFGSNRANFNIGPMRVEQLATFFEAKEVKDKLPSVALFLDFDLYRIDPEFSPETFREQLNDFLKSGSEQILGISGKLVDRYGGFA
jgi:hypothetical protein